MNLGEQKHDNRLQQSQMLRCNRPDDEWVDVLIVVPDPVANPSYVMPGDFWMLIRHLWRNSPRGFRYDLDASLEYPLPLKIRLEGIEVDCRNDLFDLLDGQDDIEQSEPQPIIAHLKTTECSNVRCARAIAGANHLAWSDRHCVPKPLVQGLRSGRG